jgi:hypothetical protein
MATLSVCFRSAAASVRQRSHAQRCIDAEDLKPAPDGLLRIDD